MIVQEIIDNKMIRTYSDEGFYIYGGLPKGNYIEALDPIDKPRRYIETNIPIEEDNDPNKETEEEKFEAFKKRRLDFENTYFNKNTH